ncbi:MAG: peptide MFS transporter [Gemmatimonas sp.]
MNATRSAVGPLGHPPGLALLFGVEMWERFSYYGMRALLVLYLVNELKWSDVDAANLYGTYTGLAYAVQIAGGYLSDRFLGTRRSLMIGGMIIASGHFVLVVPGTFALYAGLGLVIAGTGLFKPNVSTMVGQLYAAGDTRRDSGFTIFYVGINVGATFAPLVTGYLALRAGWGWGFGAAGIGMVLGLIIYACGRERYLKGIGLHKAHAGTAPRDQPKLSGIERNRILALLLLFAFVALFWMGYDQAGSSVNLFTERHVHRTFGTFEVPTAWFQSVQPFAVLLFAPLFAFGWNVLGRRQREPSPSAKMAAGLGFLSFSFVVLGFAGRLSDSGALVSPWWIVGAYVIQVLGEMCVSPVGLSYVTKVAPARFASLLMAAWFLATGLGNKLGGMMAAAGSGVPALRFFMTTAVITGIATLLLVVLVPRLQRVD